MSEFPSTGIFWIDLFIAVSVTGTLAAAGLTALTNGIIQRRQEYIETSKFKIQIIKLMAPYYIRIASYSLALFGELRNRQQYDDSMRCLYLFCNILFIRKEIFLKFGDIQLDNLDGEGVVSELINDMEVILDCGIGSEDRGRMANMVNKDLPYYKFRARVLGSVHNKTLLDRFEKWITTASPETLKLLEMNSQCFSSLLLLELNHCYNIWYGKDSRLPEDVRKHVRARYKTGQYSDYYKRTILLGLSAKEKIMRRTAIILRRH